MSFRCSLRALLQASQVSGLDQARHLTQAHIFKPLGLPVKADVTHGMRLPNNDGMSVACSFGKVYPEQQLTTLYQGYGRGDSWSCWVRCNTVCVVPGRCMYGFLFAADYTGQAVWAVGPRFWGPDIQYPQSGGRFAACGLYLVAKWITELLTIPSSDSFVYLNS